MRPYLVLDVFTDTPLEGNQLAVFTDGSGLSDERMQKAARELNLSETVFMLPAEGGGDARIRIFTTTKELPFAGHPVLGSAFVAGERLGLDVVRLETGMGVVPVALEREGEGEEIVFGRMEQPVPTWSAYDREAELFAALGCDGSTLPVEAYVNGPRYVYVGLENEDAVAALRPNMQALGELLGDTGAVPFAGSGARWKQRMFVPGAGTDEDPATGSAVGPLGVHLARHGQIGFGDEIHVAQGGEIGRPSLLHVRVEGAADRIERVEVGGSAVFVARGEYRVD
jgi:trans-2,3-dihydro-3-hydroxyanthranilate isomerase